jgi:hypothetical protein
MLRTELRKVEGVQCKSWWWEAVSGGSRLA